MQQPEISIHPLIGRLRWIDIKGSYMGLQCQTLRGIGGYEYTENDKKRNENHISLFVFANFKL